MFGPYWNIIYLSGSIGEKSDQARHAWFIHPYNILGSSKPRSSVDQGAKLTKEILQLVDQFNDQLKVHFCS